MSGPGRRHADQDAVRIRHDRNRHLTPSRNDLAEFRLRDPPRPRRHDSVQLSNPRRKDAAGGRRTPHHNPTDRTAVKGGDTGLYLATHRYCCRRCPDLRRRWPLPSRERDDPEPDATCVSLRPIQPSIYARDVCTRRAAYAAARRNCCGSACTQDRPHLRHTGTPGESEYHRAPRGTITRAWRPVCRVAAIGDLPGEAEIV